MKKFFSPSSSLVSDQFVKVDKYHFKSWIGLSACLVVINVYFRKELCLNLVRIWYIFPTRTFVLNAVKEAGIFLGVGAR